MRFGIAFVVVNLLFASAFGQMAPLPPDRLDPVNGLADLITNPNKRSEALDLIQRARWNYNLHADGGEPFHLKVSFTSSGQAALEGSGTMDETWMNSHTWRWITTIAGTRQERLGTSDVLYGTLEPVPLRVQMVRSVLYWPMHPFTQAVIRSANVKYSGEKLTCLLGSGGAPEVAAPRVWVETEYCIDAKSGLLKVWSEAPGIFAVYNYDDATVFHGHTFPRQVTVFEDGSQILNVRVESLTDAGDVEAKFFQPTPEMIAQGPSFFLGNTARFPMPVDPDPGAPAWIQPVIVHAIIGDNDGQVLDAEALQTSNRELADAAVDVVKSSAFDPTGLQREVFINVQFHQPQNYSSTIFLERLHGVVLVRRPRIAHRIPRGITPRGGFAEAGDHF